MPQQPQPDLRIRQEQSVAFSPLEVALWVAICSGEVEHLALHDLGQWLRSIQSPKEILRRFRDGETQLLCNAMLLSEGYDEPSIDCVIVLRPTTIRSLYSQQVGRGTRIHPGKENLLLLDFLWLTRQHDLIRPAALIAKDQDQQAEIEAQLERADGDLLGAQSLAQVEREAQLQRGLDERRGEGGYEIDLLELATRFAAPDIVDYRPTFAWERKAITEKQALTLRRNRVELALVRDRGHASVILARLFAWLEREPTSRKQKIYCHFLGHPQPWELTKAQANRWIAQHKAKLTQTTS